MSILISFAQHFVVNPNDTSQANKGNKIQLNWKERSKAVTICRWCDTLYIIRNPKDSIKRTISKIIGQKISLQKQVREGNGNPLQYSCLENSVDRGAWQAAVHRVAKSWTQLSDFTFTFHFHALEKDISFSTPLFLPGESQGRGSLVGCRLWGHTESNSTEATQQQQQLQKSVVFLYTNNELSETEIKERIQFTIASKIDK